MNIARNKKAFHDYFIEEKLEAGIELHGTEVKSIKNGKVSIKESFIRVIKNEVFIMNMHVINNEFVNINNLPETRVRKLLLHRKEIEKLMGKIAEKGYTLIPLNIYTKNRLVKVEMGLAKGKKLYDKREDLKRKDQKRDIERSIKDFNR